MLIGEATSGIFKYTIFCSNFLYLLQVSSQQKSTQAQERNYSTIPLLEALHQIMIEGSYHYFTPFFTCSRVPWSHCKNLGFSEINDSTETNPISLLAAPLCHNKELLTQVSTMRLHYCSKLSSITITLLPFHSSSSLSYVLPTKIIIKLHVNYIIMPLIPRVL